MNLYLISQDYNNDYDTYDSAVVAANDEEEARMMHPGGHENWDGIERKYGSWVNSDKVSVRFIGDAISGTAKGVICASFNAG